MPRFIRENSLSLVMFGFFVLCIGGQIVAGEHVNNDSLKQHGLAPLTYGQYLQSGAFLEAVAENWESEFLQMGMYVLLTVSLRQKGSPESKKLDEAEAVDADPRSERHRPDAPWPVRRGGWVLTLYQYSLTIILLLLFLVSFSLHVVGSVQEYNQEQREHNGQQLSTVQYLGSSQLWFESLQNWQSEFLSIGTLVVLSIVLRQRGSPESKPVASPHSQTGK